MTRYQKYYENYMKEYNKELQQKKKERTTKILQKIFIIDIALIIFLLGVLVGSYHTVSTKEIIDTIFTKEYINETNYNTYNYENGFKMPVIDL